LSFIKSNAFVSLVRAKISTIFNKFLMPTHQVTRSLSTNPNYSTNTKPIYKFWVECYGNNHALVKQIFKKRPWLMHSSDYTPPSYGPAANDRDRYQGNSGNNGNTGTLADGEDG
jgi:hypothetical protein